MFKRFEAKALIENKIYFSVLISLIFVTAFAEGTSAYVGNNDLESVKIIEIEGTVKSDSDTAESENFTEAGVAENNDNQNLAPEESFPLIVSGTSDIPSESIDLSKLNSPPFDSPPKDVKTNEEKKIETAVSQKIVSIYDNFKEVSENIIYLKATQKISANNKSIQKLPNKSNLAIKETIETFETNLSNFVKIYYDYSTNPYVDVSIKASLSNHIHKERNYFSERFQLEISKFQNIVSKTDYLLKKYKIDEKYIALKIQSNLSFDSPTVNKIHLLTVRSLQVIKEDVKALANLYPEGLLAPMSIMLTLYFLKRKDYFLKRKDYFLKRKDYRESEEAKMIDLKCEFLNQQTIEKEFHLKLLESRIVMPNNEEIFKYGCPKLHELEKNNSKIKSSNIKY